MSKYKVIAEDGVELKGRNGTFMWDFGAEVGDPQVEEDDVDLLIEEGKLEVIEE